MLPKTHRLTLTAFKPSSPPQIHSSEYLNLKLYQTNPDAPTRFAFVISKKTAPKATVRNLLKRRYSALVQKHLPSLQPGFDLILYLKTPALTATSTQLETSLLSLLNTLRVIK